MALFTDMLGREVDIPYPPKRIISVVPSQTELLYDLGLDEEVIGITKFCIHPDNWFRNKTRIGGTKNLNIDKILSLSPDLIIANKEENTQEQIEALAAYAPVWISNIGNLDEALEMIISVGAISSRTDAANLIAKNIKAGIENLKAASTAKRVAYLIWREPWMTAGGDTFISDIIERMGWVNVFKEQQRYPEITSQIMAESKPDTVLLSSEPYPFKEKHIAEVQVVLPKSEIKLVDGEMFSWYGSRLVKAVDYLQSLATG